MFLIIHDIYHAHQYFRPSLLPSNEQIDANLTIRDTLIAVKTYFRVYLWGCFQKKLSYESVDRVKKMHPHQCGLHHPIRARIYQKFALLLRILTLKVWSSQCEAGNSTTGSPDFLFFEFKVETYNHFSLVFILQMVRLLSLYNHESVFPNTYLFIYLLPFLSILSIISIYSSYLSIYHLSYLFIFLPSYLSFPIIYLYYIVSVFLENSD
jgi:hypothetical protein